MMFVDELNILTWGGGVFVLFLALLGYRYTWLLVFASYLGYQMIGGMQTDIERLNISFSSYLFMHEPSDMAKLILLIILVMIVPIFVWGLIIRNYFKYEVGSSIGEVFLSVVSDSERNRRVFSGGALVIDQASKWFIVIAVFSWFFWERDASNISGAWNSILQAEGQRAELGRKRAIEELHGYSENLSFLKLSGSDLEGLSVDYDQDDTKKAKMIGIDLSETYLHNANFSGANLIDANFSGAFLYGANFALVDMKKADLRGAYYGESSRDKFTSFVGANLEGADLSDSKDIKDEISKGVGDFRGGHIRSGGAYFLGADLRGAKIGHLAAGSFLRNIPTLLKYEREYFEGWVFHNILSARQWDIETVFPGHIEALLLHLGIREGRPIEGEEGYNTVETSEIIMVDLLKSIGSLNEDILYEIESMKLDESIIRSASEAHQELQKRNETESMDEIFKSSREAIEKYR